MVSKAWRTEYSPKIVKRLEKIRDKSVVRAILKKCEKLVDAPKQGKMLSGKAGEQQICSLRVGTKYAEMRVLYKLIEEEWIIYLYYVDTREEVYKLMERWI